MEEYLKEPNHFWLVASGIAVVITMIIFVKYNQNGNK